MTTKTNLAQPSFNSTSWNTPLNSNFNITNLAFGETASANVAAGNATLSSADAQNQRIVVTGSPGAPRTVFLPNGVTGSWIVTNQTDGVVTIRSDGGGAVGTTIQPRIDASNFYSTTVFAAVFNASVEVFSAESDVIKKTGDTMVGPLNCASNGFNVGSGQLQVSGNNVLSTGSFQANVNVTALSDERVKESIETIEGALAMVKQMRGVRYRRKDTGDTQVGVISQEVEKVVPEAVIHGREGLLHVAYGNLVGVLINAIKELEDRVSKLEG